MRYLVHSDIHGNLPAFEAVLADAPPGLPVWCLGDLVGYGPNPNECVELLRTFEHECIVGNHDWAAKAADDPDKLRDFNPDALRSVLWTQEQLTATSIAYLRGLEEKLVRGEFTLAHGSPREPIWEYILHPPIARLNYAYLDTPHCLVGHTHVPVKFSYYERDGTQLCEMERLVEGGKETLGNGRLILNPGSVGQPRDGDARASYAVLDTEDLTYEHRRVHYDIRKTQQMMQKKRLPERNSRRLTYGW
jgi:diadenosine tetraphosphatase ApaH/serine/threonine PP2A family protein phosphatase